MNLFITLMFAAILASVCLGSAPGYGYRRSRYGYGGQPSYGYGYKKCPKLDDPKFGSVKITSLHPGSKAIHSCNKGYVLNGNRIRICQKNGDWTGKPPTCDPIDCGRPPKPDINGEVEYTDTTLGNTATYTCNSGYELSTGGDTFVIKCLPSGEWSDDAPDCDPVDCGSPPYPDENGDVAVGLTTYKSTAIYSCKEGYILDYSNGGSQWIYCLASGNWSGTAPDCAPINCGFLPAPKYGAVEFDPDTTLRSYARFSCDYGFKLVGSKTRHCAKSGDWTEKQPTCERIKYQYGYKDHDGGYDNKYYKDGGYGYDDRYHTGGYN